jgi:hypothetical protein
MSDKILSITSSFFNNLHTFEGSAKFFGLMALLGVGGVSVYNHFTLSRRFKELQCEHEKLQGLVEKIEQHFEKSKSLSKTQYEEMKK